MTLLGDAAAAEDVTAVAFERAHRKRGGFDEARGVRRAWQFRIALKFHAGLSHAEMTTVIGVSESDAGTLLAPRDHPAEERGRCPCLSQIVSSSPRSTLRWPASQSIPSSPSLPS